MEPSIDDVGRSPGGDCQGIHRLLDQSPSLGLWYGIRCIPTILYFVDGEERVGIFGMTSKEAILSQLKPVISSQDGSGFTSLGKD